MEIKRIGKKHPDPRPFKKTYKKYYEPLYNFIIQTIKSGFLPEAALKRLCIVNSPEESIDYIDNFNL